MDIKRLFFPFSILFISFVIYLNTLQVPFVFDDIPNIVENLPLTSLNINHFLSFENIRARSVAYLSFLLNYRLHGSDVVGYHIINILIHAVNGILIFHLLTLLHRTSYFFTTRIPVKYLFFIISVLWTVHPLHVQSVTYIVQRMNSLATLFYLLSLILYLEARSGQTVSRSIYYAGTAVCFFLAVGTKEMTVTLPAVLLLIEIIFIEKSFFGFFKKHYIPFTIAFAGVFFIAWYFIGNDPLTRLFEGSYANRDFTLGQRLWTELRVVAFYISLLVYPHPSRLNLEHDFALSQGLFHPLTTLTSLVVILLLLAWAGVKRKAEPVFAFGVFFYFITLFVESSFIGLEIIFEHRTYLPSIFLVAGFVYYLFRCLNPKIGYVICIFIFILFSFWTWQRNLTWQTERALLEDCVRKSPLKARPHYNLGMVYAEDGESLKAIEFYKKALALDPKPASYRTNLAIELIRMGDYDQAERYLLESLEIKNDYSHTLNALADLYVKKKNFTKAKNYYIKNVTLNPGNYEANKAYGDFLINSGDITDAIHFYRTALAIDENTAILNNLSTGLALMGKMQEAVTYLVKAFGMSPDDKMIKDNLKSILLNWKKQINDENTESINLKKNIDRLIEKLNL